MQPEITYGRWIKAETNYGTEAIPFDVVYSTQNQKKHKVKKSDIADFIEGNKVYEIEVVDGYGARLTLPGYLDCTAWAVFETEEEAKEYLEEMYDVTV